MGDAEVGPNGRGEETSSTIPPRHVVAGELARRILERAVQENSDLYLQDAVLRYLAEALAEGTITEREHRSMSGLIAACYPPWTFGEEGVARLFEELRDNFMRSVGLWTRQRLVELLADL